MSEVQPGTIIAGKYRLIERISGGGMGSVWLAHHSQLDAPVALKFMHGSLLDVHGARSRFEREAKAAAQIRSPYVVHVHDHGIDADTGAPFIVMEYLEGQDLGSRLKRGRRLAMPDAVRICEQVCKGLHRAHKLGIVHRDLKPGNIFLSTADDDMVKLLDFGIAKETGNRRVVRGETTTTGQVLGSPHYMSPEQARGQPLDGRSDLWSLGVILFRAITGKRPFDGDDIGDLIVRICTDPIPTPSSLNPELRPEVDAFFQRSFSRDPAGRFQTARAFAAEFKAAVLGLPKPIDADASGPVPSLPDSRSPSWDSKGSGSFTSSVMGGEVDDDALTLATPSIQLRTPVDASHTLGAMGPQVNRSRRRLLWGALALVTIALGGALAFAFGAVGTGSTEQTAAPVATPAEVPAASEAASEQASEPASEKTSEVPPPTASSAAESAKSAPRPRGRPRPHPPSPPPPPKSQTDPDLGY